MQEVVGSNPIGSTFHICREVGRTMKTENDFDRVVRSQIRREGLLITAVGLAWSLLVVIGLKSNIGIIRAPIFLI